MHVSQSSNGVITTMFGIGGVVGALASGMPSDRFGSRWPFQLIAAILYVVAGIVFYFSQHYYQLLLFRLINGMASGMACSMLYTTVGDVYPADLLGFKVAIVLFSNNIAYTIGPVCGQRLFELHGVRGTASIVIAFGIVEAVLLLTVGEESLTIRRTLNTCKTPAESFEQKSSTTTAAATLSLQSCSAGSISHKGARAPDSATEAFVRSCPSISSGDENNAVCMPVWKLLTQLPVLVSTLSIFVATCIQCTLEALVPLHLSDDFNRSDSTGVTFVIFGLALTILVPLVGKASDRLLERYGDHVRFHVMLFGSLATIAAILIMAMANSYALLMIGYVLFAFSSLCMYIPAQSAYGELVNCTEANAMAQSCSISVIAWAVGAIAMPPVGSVLYASFGFTKPIIGLSAGACILCAAACLAYPARNLLARQ
ncbi:hypothetical protein IWW37_005619 [Coemansia sp. RSA 2050]|nr:hypothetical protein IWW37_005619 [Coemansia sp. RSA 2050]KAJ2729452.1 hypothetical protein IW152_005626 [Coemansia sp. BCRC 34962]